MGLRTVIRSIWNKYKPLSITFGITVCNEADELDALLKSLIPQTSSEDLILILQDITHPSPEVDSVIKKYKSKMRLIRSKLNNNFSEFKNNLIANAKGNYLFQIDADELLPLDTVALMRKDIRAKPKAEVFLISRENYVDGITPAHLEKWKLKVDEKNRINYPDFQYRVLKLNGKIKWKNKVHEVFTGYTEQAELSKDIYLIHKKAIKKQEQQNAYYETLEVPAAT